MELVIPYTQQSYIRLKLFEAYWRMTEPPQQDGDGGNGGQDT